MERLKELSSFNYINLDLERHWKRKTHSCLTDVTWLVDYTTKENSDI